MLEKHKAERERKHPDQNYAHVYDTIGHDHGKPLTGVCTTGSKATNKAQAQETPAPPARAWDKTDDAAMPMVMQSVHDAYHTSSHLRKTPHMAAFNHWATSVVVRRSLFIKPALAPHEPSQPHTFLTTPL